MADGAVVTNGGYPPPPPYSGSLKDLPEGKMFHTITYGKGVMGSHASQLNHILLSYLSLGIQELSTKDMHSLTEQQDLTGGLTGQ